jgi:hypothetical protein
MLEPGSRAFSEALDRHITGNYGEDQFREYDEDEVEEACSKPGRYGCGLCRACEEWAEREWERQEMES